MFISLIFNSFVHLIRKRPSAVRNQAMFCLKKSNVLGQRKQCFPSKEAMLFHGSSDDLEAGKAQEQLFLARMFEADGGLGVVARTFHPQHLAAAEAFVLNQ